MSHPSEPLEPGGVLKLTDKQESDLKTEIALIIDEHLADSAEFQRQLIVQRRLYELKPRRKTWPWPGAANFIMPIIRYSVDHYKGRMQQQFRMSPHLWQGTVHGVVERSEDGLNWKEIAEDAATFLDYVCHDPSHINIMEFLEGVTDGLTKDGTVPIKVHFVSNTKRRAIRTPNGKHDFIDEPFESRVRWDPIDLQRNVWTVGGSDPDDMPIFGHWMEYTRGQLRILASKHKLDKTKVDLILRTPDDPWFIHEERILDEEMGLKRESLAMSRTLNVFRIYELTVEHQFSDDEAPHLMTIWWHQNTQTVLHAFDPQDYAKPWEVARFLRRGKQYLGSGISESLRVLNLGANTVVNQTTDAQTIANAYGFLYKADSPAAEFIAQSGIFPAVKIPVQDDVTKEFSTFQLGTGNTATSIQLLNFFLQMAEMIAKIGPSQLGNVSSGSRVAASVGLGVMQEGNQMIDSVIARLRDTIDRCGLRTIMLYANHDPDVFDAALPKERATALLSAIRDPSANFPLRVKVHVSVASAASNREKDKQDLVVLANFLFTVFNSIIEKAPFITSPELPIEAKQIVAYVYKGMSEVARRLISMFDQFKDPDAALPPEILQVMERLAGIADDSGGGPAPGVFPRIDPTMAPPPPGPPGGIAPAATGPAPPGAADIQSLIGALGGM
jgi:hypothetical protein